MLCNQDRSKFKKQIFIKYRNRFILKEIFEYLSPTDKLLIFPVNKFIINILKRDCQDILVKLKKKFKGYLQAYAKGKYEKLDTFLKNLKKNFLIVNSNYDFFAKYFFSRWFNNYFNKEKKKAILKVNNLYNLSEDTRVLFVNCIISSPYILSISLDDCLLSSDNRNYIENALQVQGKLFNKSLNTFNASNA